MNYQYASKEERKKRKKEMTILRNNGETIQEIANKYDLSRERVRQIVGNTGKRFRRILTQNLVDKTDLTNMTAAEIKELPGLQRVWREKSRTVHHATNRAGDTEERIASKLLSEHGIENKLCSLRCAYDILTNDGIRIDVKHTNFDVNACATPQYAGPTFQIPHMKKGKDCDFFFIMLPDKEEITGISIFIIPASEIKSDRIRIPWPQCGRKPSKWHKYLNHYDFLIKP